MMSIQEVSPDQLAELFHHYHEALARDSGCSGESLHQTWERLPIEEKSRLIAAARLSLLELSAMEKNGSSRSYFAKPGEAEWGC